jgi:serine/threonine protein kinase/tetratricopeptide (TPR) repeat protein
MPDPGRRAARAVRLRELFAVAVETPPDRREEWLVAHTGADENLLQELRELLAADADASALFRSAVPGSTTAETGSVNPALGTPTLGRIGHYRLDERVGAGGMGQVFKPWDLALDRPAAVKLIRSNVGHVESTRLLREVAASAQLQHPAIATFFEGGTAEGTVYLAMELVDGTTLRQRLGAGPIPSTEALTVVTGLLEALAHAHAAGLLHRDIKPENIMLTPAGQPKLLDFGIARLLSAIEDNDPIVRDIRTTASGRALATAAAGTPGYMSPEQLRGELLTPASDVFQVGAVLFEMLTGRRAFGGSPVARIAATLAGPPDLTPLATLRPHRLSSLVAKALAFDAADRFESAALFLREVDALVDGRLRSAVPESLLVADFAPAPSDVRTGSSIGDARESSRGYAHEWIGRALSEVLGRQLSRWRGVRVVGGPSVAQASAALTAGHEIIDPVQHGLRLGVRWVVAGRYRRDGDRLRVTVQLFDSSTGVEVHRFESAGTIDEVLSQPDTLALPIVNALGVGLPAAPEDATVRQARAVELQLTARQLWSSGNRAAYPRVYALIDKALEVAPDFVPALTVLAGAHATAFIASRDPADLEQALAAADRAISIDAGCAEAWSWRAYALLRQQRVDEALASYEQATRAGTDPMSSYLYGSTLSNLGRFEEALPHLQRAVTLEPRHGIGWLSLGWTLHSLLREEAARFALSRAKALEGQPGPTFIAGVGGYIADCLRSLGELDLARAEALEGLNSIERSDHAYRDTIRAFCLGALARVALAQGDDEGARVAYAQAVAQMRGRKLTLAGGHALVQALAGLARATNDGSHFREGLTLFEERESYSFNLFFGCSDDTTAFELALAADALGLAAEATRLLNRARMAGNRRSFPLRKSS